MELVAGDLKCGDVTLLVGRVAHEQDDVDDRLGGQPRDRSRSHMMNLDACSANRRSYAGPFDCVRVTPSEVRLSEEDLVGGLAWNEGRRRCLRPDGAKETSGMIQLSPSADRQPVAPG